MKDRVNMKTTGREIIIYDIIGNGSQYQWKDLNCFYRIFALTLSAVEKSYFEMYVILISLYLLYVTDETSNLSFNAEDDVIKYYNTELKNIFGSPVMMQEYTSYRKFKQAIERSLAEKNAVIIPCDLYYLPYSKTYLEQHRRHYILIKGINPEKEIVYVIDNMHNDLGAGTEYSDFIMELHMLYSMNCSFCKIFDQSRQTYFWYMNLKKNPQCYESYTDYFGKIYEKLRFKLVKQKPEDDYEWQLCSGQKQFDSRKYMGYVNTKIMLFKAVKNLLLTFGTGSYPAICEKIDSYIDQRERFKIAFAFLVATEKERQELFDKIEKLKLMEMELLESYLQIMTAEKTTGQSPKQWDQPRDYIVTNRKNALVEMRQKEVHIVLEEDFTYDIWKNCSDGVMVYQPIRQECGEFKTVIQGICDLGSSCHFGIVLIMSDESKWLFGSLGRYNLAIHKIDQEPEYEVYLENHIIEEKTEFRVRFCDDHVYFYIEGRQIFEQQVKSDILYCGVFAKSWEKCFCDVTFENINYVMEGSVSQNEPTA